mmetsp:Transcript_8809/g.18844  ORF Transcript_8809/g.18844 Transcript_8809/m.18844 type:complete len:324 (+) Transcript_8809:153-1124(+)
MNSFLKLRSSCLSSACSSVTRASASAMSPRFSASSALTPFRVSLSIDSLPYISLSAPSLVVWQMPTFSDKEMMRVSRAVISTCDLSRLLNRPCSASSKRPMVSSTPARRPLSSASREVMRLAFSSCIDFSRAWNSRSSLSWSSLKSLGLPSIHSGLTSRNSVSSSCWLARVPPIIWRKARSASPSLPLPRASSSARAAASARAASVPVSTLSTCTSESWTFMTADISSGKGGTKRSSTCTDAPSFWRSRTVSSMRTLRSMILSASARFCLTMAANSTLYCCFSLWTWCLNSVTCIALRMWPCSPMSSYSRSSTLSTLKPSSRS